MSHKVRILLGIVGALLPIIVNIYFYDFSKFDSVAFNWITHIVRVLILVGVGALVAYLHRTETDGWKVVQLGLAVPSLLAAIYSGQAYERDRRDIEEQIKSGGSISYVAPNNPSEGFLFSMFPKAMAQPQQQEIKKFTKPEQSVLKSVVQGVTGNEQENLWYVIVGSEKSKQEAFAKLARIKKAHPEYEVQVYEPYRNNPYHAIVIGSNLTLEAAKELRAKAIKEKIAADTFIWKLK